MTSPSRKSRRITASASTLKAAWTSLLLLASGPALYAQAQPATTTWQPYQPPVVLSPAPAPQMTVPNLPVQPTPVTPPKMALYQKPDDVDPIPLPTVPLREVPLPPLPVMPPERTVPARPAVFQKAPPAPPTPAPAPAYPAPPGTYTPPTTPDSVKFTSTTGRVPTKAELFRLDSDKTLDARIITDLNAGKATKMVEPIPPVPPLVPAGPKYVAKTVNYPPSMLLISPNFVIHRRLYFEEKNSERAGWDAGPAQSLLLAANFLKDAVLLPAHIASDIHDCYDASPGKGMPGDPTPYYLYPPGISPFGYAVELAAITGLVFIIP